MSFVLYKNLNQKLKGAPQFSNKYQIGIVKIKNNNHFVLFNNKSCQVLTNWNDPDFPQIIPVLLSQNFQKLWIYSSLNNPLTNLEQVVNLGFADPYIADSNPFGEEINHGIALTLITKADSVYDPFQTLLLIQYVLKQYKTHGCSLHVKFSEKAIKLLQNMSTKMGFSKNGNNSVSQKEITGELILDKIIEKNGNIVFVVSVAESRMENGVEEEVKVHATRYNFHSHPEEAYIRHKVNKAWPSLTDYLGFLKLGNSTIFHCVIAMEGIYVMSFSAEWVIDLKKVNKNFIKKHYDISYSSKMSPYKYVKKINHILYKGNPIFIVKFLPWNNSANTIFSVSYKKDGNNCNYY